MNRGIHPEAHISRVSRNVPSKIAEAVEHMVPEGYRLFFTGEVKRLGDGGRGTMRLSALELRTSVINERNEMKWKIVASRPIDTRWKLDWIEAVRSMTAEVGA